MLFDKKAFYLLPEKFAKIAAKTANEVIEQDARCVFGEAYKDGKLLNFSTTKDPNKTPGSIQ